MKKEAKEATNQKRKGDKSHRQRLLHGPFAYVFLSPQGAK